MTAPHDAERGHRERRSSAATRRRRARWRRCTMTCARCRRRRWRRRRSTPACWAGTGRCAETLRAVHNHQLDDALENWLDVPCSSSAFLPMSACTAREVWDCTVAGHLDFTVLYSITAREVTHSGDGGLDAGTGAVEGGAFGGICGHAGQPCARSEGLPAAQGGAVEVSCRGVWSASGGFATTEAVANVVFWHRERKVL